ncbi:MAG: hypothetical protein WBE34_01455, partial [Candidatus Nitrosopolaris sp.]
IRKHRFRGRLILRSVTYIQFFPPRRYIFFQVWCQFQSFFYLFLNPINNPGTNPNIVAIGKWGQYTYDINKSADCAQAKIVNG